MRQAFFWMMAAIVAFCTMAVSGRELSADMNITNMIAYRSAFGVLVLFGVRAIWAPHVRFRTQRPFSHLVRSTSHLMGQYGWLMGVSLLPLAQVIALEFTAPVWTLILASLVLKETLTVPKVAAVLLGLMGVYCIVRPDAGGINLHTLWVLAAAVSFACANIATKSITNHESGLQMLFFMCLLQLAISLFLVTDWVMPQGMQWLWLLLLSTSALMAHFCLIKALQITDVGLVVMIDFLRLPAMALVGMILYNESIGTWLVLGAALMVAGNGVAHISPQRWPFNRRL